MQSFILSLLVKAVENEKIRAFLLEVVDRIGDNLFPKLAALIPAAVGVAMSKFGDLLPDINLPGVDEVVETVRTEVNQMLPNGIDIPFLSDAIRNTTGFDLSDIVLGRKR